VKKWCQISGLAILFILYVPGAWAAEFTHRDSDETDVQIIMELVAIDQQRLENSGILYHNKGLEAYLNRVAARLDANASYPNGGFNVKMIRDPHLNAFTYPDGTCYIQTGILARLENEDQLAALLAHELAHYTNRHAVNGIRRFHRRSVNDQFNLPDNREKPSSRKQLRWRIECAWSGYHREAEFEADHDALKFMIHAGYEPRESLGLFKHLANEMATENLKEPTFLGTHPRLQARMKRCSELLENLNPARQAPTVLEGEFERQIQDLLLVNIDLDIRVGRFEQALQASDRYLTLHPDDARIHYLKGEIYRQRPHSDKEINRAESYYKRAINLDSGYAEAHRALGLIYYKTGLSHEAKTHLEASLTLAPDAPENGYVRNYLSRIQP
jgi:predicted Zn-dependent protease